MFFFNFALIFQYTDNGQFRNSHCSPPQFKSNSKFVTNEIARNSSIKRQDSAHSHLKPWTDDSTGASSSLGDSSYSTSSSFNEGKITNSFSSTSNYANVVMLKKAPTTLSLKRTTTFHTCPIITATKTCMPPPGGNRSHHNPMTSQPQFDDANFNKFVSVKSVQTLASESGCTSPSHFENRLSNHKTSLPFQQPQPPHCTTIVNCQNNPILNGLSSTKETMINVTINIIIINQ